MAKWNPSALVTPDVLRRAKDGIRLDVAEPPCKSCLHFRPVVEMGGDDWTGVRMCHAKEMFSDFSCCEPKADP